MADQSPVSSPPAAPKVSVAMVTYNHARYIKQAVESILCQKTNFPFVIVIGDDCSTDGTREQLVALAQQNPGRIHLLLHEKNLGCMGKPNFAAVIQACRGEYVAYLEGDDYWDAPDKLQRQVDFLDTNPEFVGCIHDIRMLKNDQGIVPHDMGYPEGVDSIGLREMLKYGFPHLLTMVFRRKHLTGLPDWFFDVCMGDWSLFSLLVSHGPMAYLRNWPVGIYRIHGTSYWLGKPFVERTFDEIHAYGVFLKIFPPEHHRAIWQKLNRHQFWLVDAYLAAGDRGAARGAYWEAVKGWPRNRGVPLDRVVHYYLQLYLPALLRGLQRLRHRTPRPA